MCYNLFCFYVQVFVFDLYMKFHEYGICFGLDEYLVEIYRAYNPKGRFEVVFVALGNNERAFHDSFSCMPWLATYHTKIKKAEISS